MKENIPNLDHFVLEKVGEKYEREICMGVYDSEPL